MNTSSQRGRLENTFPSKFQHFSRDSLPNQSNAQFRNGERILISGKVVLIIIARGGSQAKSWSKGGEGRGTSLSLPFPFSLSLSLSRQSILGRLFRSERAPRRIPSARRSPWNSSPDSRERCIAARRGRGAAGREGGSPPGASGHGSRGGSLPRCG